MKKKKKREKENLRRTNTLPWSDPNPRVRQTKLEDITKSRMADTWFSIHVDGVSAPAYVSEVVESATNADFRAFDLNMCGPEVSRSDYFTVKLWARPSAAAGNDDGYVLLVEWELSLQSLQFLGKSLETFHHPLPPNSIVFHFPDGVYSSFTDLPPQQQPPLPWSEEGEHEAVPTCSYDVLMRLANLDECIQDALITREKLEAQINTVLMEHRHALEAESRASQAQESLAHTKQVAVLARRQLRASSRRKQELLASLEARRQGMQRGRQAGEMVQSELPEARMKLMAREKHVYKTVQDSHCEIRRISEDLMTIYPIEPIPGKPLSFTIAGLALPNSQNFASDSVDRDAVAAALGYTAHLVCLLSVFLSMPLPYPPTPYLSNSSIHDPISFMLPQRTYPLHPVNANYRFEYGVFLLNKDIEFLLSRQGLRIIDLRHSLPNLKYLMYLLTSAGPVVDAGRRAGSGSIRGLFPMLRPPSISSRRGSEDSGSANNGEAIFSTNGLLLFGTSPNSNANGGPPATAPATTATTTTTTAVASSSGGGESICRLQKGEGGSPVPSTRPFPSLHV